MISLNKVTSVIPNLTKTTLPDKPIINEVTKLRKQCNLNLQPHSYCMPSNIFKSASQTLKEFQEEFGEIKSPTYLCEKIKQAKKAGNEALMDELSELRRVYSPKVKKMRREIYTNKFSSFDEYISKLKGYIKENGTYMNCQECSDLMQHSLQKKGIKSNNVVLYTLNSEGQKTSKAEHVFNVVGLDKNATNDPSTWGNCYIVDGWSGICMPHKKGIDFFQNFFGIDPSKHKLAFEFQ